jgi:hypothetical protein
MFIPSFDILKKNGHRKPILLAVVMDLETTRARFSEITSCMPGDYFVFDPRTHQTVAG